MQVRRRARCGCGRSGHVVGSGWLVGLLLFPFTFIDSGHYMYVSRLLVQAHTHTHTHRSARALSLVSSYSQQGERVRRGAKVPSVGSGVCSILKHHDVNMCAQNTRRSLLKKFFYAFKIPSGSAAGADSAPSNVF